MLRLSTYLSISFEHRKNIELDQYDYGYLFFYELASLEVEKPYNNNLFNGVRDLTNETKNFLLNDPVGKKKCASFIINWLIPSLQTLTIDDYYEKIRSIISSDESISDKNKNTLIKPYKEEKYEIFLCKSFMYAISKDNINVKDKIDPDDLEYILEANKLCSNCGKSIEVKKNKKTAYKYGIVSIFPEFLELSKKGYFLSIAGKEPTDYSHRSNKICCCCSCADDYECSPTTDMFIKLRNKKEIYIKKENENSVLEKAKLDDELETILVNLHKIKSFSEIEEFRTTPLTLKEKIESNELLRLTIKNDVENYYNYIRQKLSDLDDLDSEFKIIGSQFQICYEKLAKIMTDQEEIFNRIIKWVLDELHLSEQYNIAARIIVSFFVQNCEVFDEISK